MSTESVQKEAEAKAAAFEARIALLEQHVSTLSALVAALSARQTPVIYTQPPAANPFWVQPNYWSWPLKSVTVSDAPSYLPVWTDGEPAPASYTMAGSISGGDGA